MASAEQVELIEAVVNAARDLEWAVHFGGKLNEARAALATARIALEAPLAPVSPQPVGDAHPPRGYVYEWRTKGETLWHEGFGLRLPIDENGVAEFRNWTPLYTHPEAEQRGFRAGIEAAAALIRPWLDTQTLKLHAGEMTAQEIRSVKAVLNAILYTLAERQP